MAMRKAETIHEELKRNMHLEHLKEQHTTKDPQCKSCQEGLTTRTPAKSKEDGVRGTDAGYVLGVDFQGPFVKSINGKQWCLVAVEAQHGYTIVKTLKDKKAKTVKAAMQEIICEFQIAIGKGNTFVVRVHSDNDNSLIAEVKDYLRKECIEQTFTEPYDHNANAKVERKNRKLMGIFRTCLIEATQGTGKYKELWCVGLEHAAMAANQAPEAGEKSPAARIGARIWDFQKDFHVFGAACTAWEPIEQRDDKMEQVAGKAVWLGLSQTVSGAHVVAPLQWDSDTNQWHIEHSKVCRTVQVNNNKYPLQLVAKQGQTDYSDFDKFVEQFSAFAQGSNIYRIQAIKDVRVQRGKTQYLVKWDGTRSPEWNDADLVIYYGGETHINKYLKKQSRQNRVQLHAVVTQHIKHLET